MFEDTEKRRQVAKWLIGVITICILIFLGLRHIGHVAGAVSWLTDLTKPLLIGIILALFLNVSKAVVIHCNIL